MGDLKHYYSNMDPENLSVDLRYNNVVSIINLLVFTSKRGSPYKSTSVLILSDNKWYKINTILWKMMAVQKVVGCIFNFKTAGAKRIYTLLKIMSESMFVKMTKT